MVPKVRVYQVVALGLITFLLIVFLLLRCEEKEEEEMIK